MESMTGMRRTRARAFFELKPNRKRGFTLVELMVVLAIVGVLLAVGIPAFNESRGKSRDAKRISDLKQLEFALEVYAEARGGFPQVEEPTVIGEGGALDEVLAPFMGSVPKDPLGSASDDIYEYVYESGSSCGVAVYAKTMEREENVNAGTTCSELSGRVVALGGWDIESTTGDAPTPTGEPAAKTFNGITFTRSDHGGNAYYSSDQSVTAAELLDLSDAVQADGGHILTISSDAENTYISENIDSTIWLGLVQNPSNPGFSEPAGGWEWLNGETVTYTNWNAGEPNDWDNGNPGEDYAEMYPDGTWNDIFGSYGGTDSTRELIIEYDDEGASPFGGGPDGYTYCVDEHETCTFSGIADVAYGADGSFYYRSNVNGSIECSNSVFGDPIQGTFKACYTKQN